MKDLPLPLLAFIIFAVVYVIIHVIAAAMSKLSFGPAFKYNISFGAVNPDWPADTPDKDKEAAKKDMISAQLGAFVIGVLAVLVKFG